MAPHYARTLDIAPSRLADRLHESLVEPDPVAAVRNMSQLVVDVLALVPDEIDVRAARRGSERRLAAASVETAVYTAPSSRRRGLRRRA